MDNKLTKLLISLFLPLAAGAVGWYFTIPSISPWYEALNKPFFNPPNQVFGPVWTVLHILMGLSLYLIWTSKGSKTKKIKQEGIRLFAAQLILNVLWSIVFFGFHSITLAAAVIVVLLILIYVTIKIFAKVSKPASYLLYPYLAWVFFAMILNVGIVILNS